MAPFALCKSDQHDDCKDKYGVFNTRAACLTYGKDNDEVMIEECGTLEKAEVWAYGCNEAANTQYNEPGTIDSIHFPVLPRELRAVIYVDGAVLGHGRPDARGGIGMYWGSANEFTQFNLGKLFNGRQTNQTAEIRAVCMALEKAGQLGFNEVLIRTDSEFVMKCLTKDPEDNRPVRWVDGWQENGWRTYDQRDVINRKELENAVELEEGIPGGVIYEKVPAHCGLVGNEMADKFARKAAATGQDYIPNPRTENDTDWENHDPYWFLRD